MGGVNMKDRKQNKWDTKWINWINKHLDKLTIMNYKDETLSRVSFKAGYKQAILDTGKWWDEYLSKSEFCEMEGYGSDDDAILKFLKYMEE